MWLQGDGAAPIERSTCWAGGVITTTNFNDTVYPSTRLLYVTAAGRAQVAMHMRVVG